MRINDLIASLGNPTIKFKNPALLTTNFFDADLDISQSCLTLHTINNDTPCYLRLVQDGNTGPDNTLYLDLPYALTTLKDKVQGALQWDYVASQTFESIQSDVTDQLPIQNYLDVFARHLDQSLILFDRHDELVISSTYGSLGRLSTQAVIHRLLPTLADITGSLIFNDTTNTQLAAITIKPGFTFATPLADRKQAAYTFGLLRRIGTVLVHEIETLAAPADKLATNLPAAYFSNTLLDLIHSQTINADTLKDWRLDPKVSAYIIRITFAMPPESLMVTDFLRVLTPLLGDLRYCIENTSLILICSTGQPLNTMKATLATLYQYAQKYDFSITISAPFNTIEQASVAYQQCVSTQAYAVTVPLPDRILFFQDVALLELVDQVKGRVNLTDYVHPDLQYLMAYDDDHHTDYLNTLHFYLYDDLNTKRAAADLHIHPNTLLYRIGKIKTLLNYDFSFGKQNLDYRMGFLILYSQNKVRLPRSRRTPAEDPATTI
ncbi:PucR family transcriptional regulator [Secundilactobacillus paracollinoides]|uniref:PucR C-terminal helix-turn-helix domain-containing protein n=1 Tax=Secundilactobacillus paracollinoides TaxID=240427 RepID=A0A1B2IYE9_9LACO|nr:helix-turn-helix domain-containing protein [Secundilactobacillus paracollinoides]ANZ61109.1 hypothetical protein AYR61_06985 [Secundilactobacillus paracollinoides]ANZ67030.1 hypothetical protein AYR63_07730 [Secundilactobacillus paracollinoides]